MNPRASLEEVARYLKGEPQAVACVGGYKYFYLDWNLDIWRCEAWSEPLGSVFDLDRIADRRDPCHACMMACYRNASMLMHAAIATTDAAGALAAGRIGSAAACSSGAAWRSRSGRSSRMRRRCAAWRAAVA